MWSFAAEFFELPVLPWWLQRGFTAPLALLGRMLGYTPERAMELGRDGGATASARR